MVRVVERCQLARRHSERPAVADDVVHRQQNRMVVVAELEHLGTHQRATGEVKRTPRLFGCQPKRLSMASRLIKAAEIDRRQRQWNL